MTCGWPHAGDNEAAISSSRSNTVIKTLRVARSTGTAG